MTHLTGEIAKAGTNHSRWQMRFRFGGRSMQTLTLFLVLSFFVLLPSQAARNQIPVKEIHEFAKVLEVIRTNYVDETDDKELMKQAIRGMLRDLDPYSVYLDKRQKKELSIKTQGKFGGLGIQVTYEQKAGAIKVISPIDDTPAQRAGIQSLDLIIAIDGKSTADMDLEQAINLMRGKPGTKIKIRIRRPGQKDLLDFTLVREIIKIKSVSMIPLSDDYIYARLSAFQANTASDLSRLIRDAKKKNKNLGGMILDLRNNPGGLLSSAIGVSDIFIEDGVIVSTAGRSRNSQSSSKANGYDLTNGLPVLVLINGGSASASEIVAGALQDHHRALIAGTKSFGKGTVQSIIDISSDAAVKITTAKYATPSGKFIHKIGIEPDVKIEIPRNRNATIETEAENLPEDISKGAKALFERDRQLQQAYNLLLDLVVAGGNVLEMKGI